jgi:hypothetical protein
MIKIHPAGKQRLDSSSILHLFALFGKSLHPIQSTSNLAKGWIDPAIFFLETDKPGYRSDGSGSRANTS